MRHVPDLSTARHLFVTIVGVSYEREDGTSASCPVVAGTNPPINAELEKSHCNAWTGGTCWSLPYHAHRGVMTCRDAQCQCEPGFCAVGGRCVSSSSATSVGFFKPLLYRSPGASNDITENSNNCKGAGNTCCAWYNAGPRWDAVTGMSSPRFEALNTELVN